MSPPPCGIPTPFQSERAACGAGRATASQPSATRHTLHELLVTHAAGLAAAVSRDVLGQQRVEVVAAEATPQPVCHCVWVCTLLQVFEAAGAARAIITRCKRRTQGVGV